MVDSKYLWRVCFCLIVATPVITGARSGLAQTQLRQPPLLQAAVEPEPPSLWRKEWPEFRTSEGVATLAAGVATGLIVLFGPIEQPRWQGGILFDDVIRDSVRPASASTRKTYQTIGDWTYRLSPLIPLLDAFVVSTIGLHDQKLALNLAAVTFEAYSYSGLASFVSTEISARARPDSGTLCNTPGCTVDTQSFYSGHTAIAATGAGLVCANHTRIRLYGNAVADAAACVFATTNALVTATTRLAADRHFTTDLITGFGLGFGVGYAVPVLLHYSSSKDGTSISFAPDPACGGNCLGVRGTF
jgi:membrane-associated phospholipid phosphatase